MKEFQWTDESVLEFAEHYIFSSTPVKQMIEQFKSSKAPKKEWEVVAFRHRGEIAALIEDWKEVRCYSQPHFEYPGQQMSLAWALDPANNCIIHSVRRLSDDLVFSYQETVLTPAGNRYKIESFEECNGKMYIIFLKGNLLLSQAIKLPTPVLTTVDGVELYRGEEYWGAEVGIGPCCYEAGNENFSPCANMKLFSTKEAALKYQFENRPLLSLNDVKKICQHSDQEKALAELTTLVKQKLNS